MTTLRLAAAAAVLALMAGVAAAQTTLRIGLAEDPDVLDPTLARTYVGRIVFASFCDKLFDIDDKLNVVPQLALSHETAPDGKAVTIKLRPGVKFHDGEPLDAEAAKSREEARLELGDRQPVYEGERLRPSVARADEQPVVEEVEVDLKGPGAARDGGGRQPAGGDVERDVPGVVDPRQPGEPDLAHDLGPPVQRRVRVLPPVQREGRPKPGPLERTGRACAGVGLSSASLALVVVSDNVSAFLRRRVT